MTTKAIEINGTKIEVTATTLNTGVSSTFRFIKDGKVVLTENTFWIKKGKFVGPQNAAAVIALIDATESEEKATAESAEIIAKAQARDASVAKVDDANIATEKAMGY